MKAPGFAAALAAANAYEEVAVNCGPNVQVSYAVGYDSAARPAHDGAQVSAGDSESAVM